MILKNKWNFHFELFLKIPAIFIFMVFCCKSIAADTFIDTAVFVLENSDDIKIARKNLNISSSELKKTYSPYLPQVSGKIKGDIYSEKYQDSLNEYKDFSTGIYLTQDIFNLEKIYSIKAAKKRVLSAEKISDYTNQKVLLSFGMAWINYWKALKQLETGNDNLEILNQYRKKSKVRFKEGDITVTDVRLSETRYQSALILKNRFMRELRKATLSLKDFIKKDTPQNLTLFSFEINPEGKINGEYIEKHPEVRIIMTELSAIEYEIKHYFSGHYPTLGLNSSYIYQTEGEYSSEKYPYRESKIGLELKIPIFSGNIVKNTTEQARQKKERLYLILRQTREKILRDIETSAYELVNSLKEINIAKKQLRFAEDTLSGMNEEYEMGTRSSTDLFQIQADLMDSKLSLINAEEQHARFFLNYVFAIGKLRIDYLKKIIIERK